MQNLKIIQYNFEKEEILKKINTLSFSIRYSTLENINNFIELHKLPLPKFKNRWLLINNKLFYIGNIQANYIGWKQTNKYSILLINTKENINMTLSEFNKKSIKYFL